MLRKLNKRNARVYFNKRIDILMRNINLETDKSILDIGCGDGTFLNQLKERYPRLFCFGIDVSLLQLEGAGNNINAKFCCAQVEKLPFNDDEFDVVVVNSVLHHVHNIKHSIKEIIRVCKTRGAVVIIEPNRFNPLIFMLSLIKKHERGMLGLSQGSLKITLANNTKLKYLTTLFLNSLCYPYQKWPPKNLFRFICKMEDFLSTFLRSNSHFVIIAKGEVNKL
ncbi:MAG: class I SAM-dependent methyltransferase [Candidatus Omnitrophica bacterium]|nr:class I SAM-dependent methyltransferase [Candidatus Omnitrophota bacterium]